MSIGTEEGQVLVALPVILRQTSIFSPSSTPTPGSLKSTITTAKRREIGLFQCGPVKPLTVVVFDNDLFLCVYQRDPVVIVERF